MRVNMLVMQLWTTASPVVHEIKNAHIKRIVGKKKISKMFQEEWPLYMCLQMLTPPDVMSNSFLYVGDKVGQGICTNVYSVMYMYNN